MKRFLRLCLQISHVMPAVGEEVIDSQQVGFAPYGLLNTFVWKRTTFCLSERKALPVVVVI
ncbi:hypothetical protein [Acidovorax sp. SUPP2539]|uniref:hypothetical protein n=1 Tax=Acidovorax sp. SUPP2539 TaxID=2920878 RepID=UPI0023DE4435|nr:hypothetical protein [Acidovorax sp. SUPP2539]GKS89453.1 hypothetical protein AVTE2539_08830 [Acidovorax sp. SUPP2539]